MWQLPNLLTFLRIGLLIPFVCLFYTDARWANWVAVIIFWAACITDFFDGYVARLMNQESALGRFLDPIADKLLVSASLLMLAGTGRIEGLTLLPAVVILCREILVSGLREWLAELSISMPVSRLAKWKTGIQMVAISSLLFDDAKREIWFWKEIGTTLLWIAALLTLATGYDYLKRAYLHKHKWEKN